MLAADSSLPSSTAVQSPPVLPGSRRRRDFSWSCVRAVGETVGEAVFATAMSGYQEALTDPSCHRRW